MVIGKRGKDCRKYNFPSVFEVAALIVGVDVLRVDGDIIVETHIGDL